MVIRKHARYSASWMVIVIHNGVEYTPLIRFGTSPWTYEV